MNSAPNDGYKTNLSYFISISMMLKWVGNKKQQTPYNAITALATRDGVNDLRGVFSMLCENIDIMIAESAKKALAQGFEQGFIQGFIQGFKQGLEQGEKRANAAIIKTMVTMRFGNIPEHIAAQIDAASADQLVEWHKRLFIASNLDTVFGVN